MELVKLDMARVEKMNEKFWTTVLPSSYLEDIVNRSIGHPFTFSMPFYGGYGIAMRRLYY